MPEVVVHIGTQHEHVQRRPGLVARLDGLAKRGQYGRVPGLAGGGDQVVAAIRGEVELDQVLGADEQFGGSRSTEPGRRVNGGGCFEEDTERGVAGQAEADQAVARRRSSHAPPPKAAAKASGYAVNSVSDDWPPKKLPIEDHHRCVVASAPAAASTATLPNTDR